MLTIDYDLIGIRDGERILDAGCGEGRHSWEACKRNKCLVCALDVDETSLKKANYAFYLLDKQGESKGKWLILKGDVLKLPFKDASFEKVICSEVLEHIHDDLQGIRELARVLREDGILAISVPSYIPETICWKLSEGYHSKPGGHIRIYKASELISKLEQNKLHVYAIRRKHALHSFYWILRCLFGINNEKALLPSLYHKFLVWDIYHNSKPIRLLDRFLNKFFAKSLVIYARKSKSG
ncbi:MAG: class I SAM-dependent methyltransferase [candidate division KSB1 bacterium]|nr:class I SAM-dependent methyltransferase [candidate division KSB1 bacterium]